MKSGIVVKWGLGLGLVVLPLTTNCLAEDAVSPTVQVAAVAEQESTNAAPSRSGEPAVTNSTNAVDITEAPATPITQEKAVPPNIHPTRPLAEIIKLTNSGVEENVMMAYVTNSTSTFNLSAEEIIYLKDIGVPDRVVTAMILRDQTLRADSATALAAAAPPAADEPAVAPNASEVAPQPDAMAAQYPPEPAPGPTEVADDSAFYGALSPYGSWMNVAGYGPVWQPTVVVVNPGWAPYYNCGRWMWTDCGWYWCSDYTWGWAPFHYGRWFCHSRLGWCWAPDRVWGPSWVSWRYTDSHCGWAPLPPGTSYAFGVGLTYHGHAVAHNQDVGLKATNYRFVAWNHFRERDFQHHRIAPQQRDQLFKHSVVATSFSGDNQKIVNDGLPPQKVASATGTQVRRVAIREETGTARLSGGAERYDPTGRTVTVYRPRFEQTSTPRGGNNPVLTHNPQSHEVPGLAPGSAPTRNGNFDEPMKGYARTAPSQPAARPAPAAPLILHGPQNSAVKETPPSSSLVIIGRKDPNGTQTTYQSTVPSANPRPVPGARTAPGQQTWTGSTAASPTPWADNEVAEAPNQTWHQSPPATVSPNYRPWTYAPRTASPAPAFNSYERPSPTYRPPTPAYQAPARSAPAEVPRYTPPPANNVQRSYSPPPAAPAPSRPAPSAPPAASAPAQASGGGRNQR